MPDDRYYQQNENQTSFVDDLLPRKKHTSPSHPAHETIWSALFSRFGLRLTLTYTLTLLLGAVLAFGASALTGLVSPGLRGPTFLVVFAWWAWQGWKYSGRRG